MSARFVLGIAVVIAVWSPRASSQQSVTVRGRVLHADTGKPVAGADVMGLTIADTVSTRTDANGRYEMRVAEAPMIVVSKTGFVTRNVRLDPGARSSDITLPRGGVIVVRVVDGSGTLVAGVPVTVTCDGTSSTAPTSDLGERRVGRLPAGSCQVVATQLTSVTATAKVSAGEEVDVVLRFAAKSPGVPPGARSGSTGVIAGTIYDEYGDPIENIAVQAIASDRPRTTVPSATVRTDDRGAYRFTGLAPGTYRVTTTVSRGSVVDTLFYAGARQEHEAIGVRVVEGRETGNIDIKTSPPSTAAVRGSAVLSSGSRVEGGWADLLGTGDRPNPVMRTVMINPDGRFVIGDVPPGTYELRITAEPRFVSVTRSGEQTSGPARPPLEFFRQSITVGQASPPQLSVRTMPMVTLTGRLTFEGSDSPLPSDFRLIALADQHTVIVPAADGTFTFTNLWVPTRFALVPVVPGWWLKSFQVGDVDAANQTLDFSTGPRVVRDVTAVLARAARITGRVTFDGAATERALVVAFAADPQRWYQDSIYIRLAQSRPDGYSLDVPPGRYHLVALDGFDGLRGVDVSLFTRLQRVAATVSVTESGAVIDLRATAIPR